MKPLNAPAPLFLLLALSLCFQRPATAQPPPIPDRDVQDQITLLGDDDIVTRDKAAATLKGWATGNRLTAAQIGMIRAARSDGDKERSYHAKQVYACWATQVPAIRAAILALLDLIRTQTNLEAAGMTGFTFDAMGGSVPSGNPTYAELLKRYQAARDAILAADSAAPAGGGDDPITAAVKALRDFVNGLGAAEFAKLGITVDGVPATKAQVLDKINQALIKVPGVRDLLAVNSGGEFPVRPTRSDVLAGSHVQPDLGRTLTMVCNTVLTSGQMDVFFVLEPETMSLPPSGYRIVGSAFDLLPDSNVAVQGPVTLTIEYGPDQSLGTPVCQEESLRVARLANGRMEILATYTLDPVNHSITGTYDPEPAGGGLNQFGEFAVIESTPPVPGASPWALALLALALATGGAVLARSRIGATWALSEERFRR